MPSNPTIEENYCTAATANHAFLHVGTPQARETAPSLVVRVRAASDIRAARR